MFLKIGVFNNQILFFKIPVIFIRNNILYIVFTSYQSKIDPD